MSSLEPHQPPSWEKDLADKLNQIAYWASRHWLAVFNSFAFLYVGLPILAPILMGIGFEKPARGIYTMYKPMCHQMASRSFFLFGEQYAYPRSVAPTPHLTPIEAYQDQIPALQNISLDYDNWPLFTAPARAFLGNSDMGYKMALCERDIGIYMAIFLSGLLYSFIRKRWTIKPLPIWVFLLFFMGPIALDGFSQLFGYMGTEVIAEVDLLGPGKSIFTLFPLRESTPFLRSFTGALFGLGLVWVSYPRIGDGMEDTEDQIHLNLDETGLL